MSWGNKYNEGDYVIVANTALDGQKGIIMAVFCPLQVGGGIAYEVRVNRDIYELEEKRCSEKIYEFEGVV